MSNGLIALRSKSHIGVVPFVYIRKLYSGCRAGADVKADVEMHTSSSFHDHGKRELTTIDELEVLTNNVKTFQ